MSAANVLEGSINLTVEPGVVVPVLTEELLKVMGPPIPISVFAKWESMLPPRQLVWTVLSEKLLMVMGPPSPISVTNAQ